MAGLVKAMDVVWTFLVREYTRVVFAMRVSPISLLLYFSKEPCYHPTYQAERWECKSKHFVQVLLHCICCKTVWIWRPCHMLGKLLTQPGGKKDLLVGFPRIWLLSEKLSDKVSNRMSLLHSWTPSLF